MKKLSWKKEKIASILQDQLVLVQSQVKIKKEQ